MTTLTPGGQRLADALAYLTPHPTTKGPVILDPAKMRASVSVIGAALDAPPAGGDGGLREALVKADIQIGDGHIEAARRTLHAAMDALARPDPREQATAGVGVEPFTVDWFRSLFAEPLWNVPHWQRDVLMAVSALTSQPTTPAPATATGSAGMGVREALKAKAAEHRAEAVRCDEAGSYTSADQARAVAAAYEDALALTPPQAARPALERVRHVKRGTEYEVLGEAEAQVSRNRSGEPATERYLWDGCKLTVYRDPTTGKLWCRFTDEFRDGRFVTLPVQADAAEGRS